MAGILFQICGVQITRKYTLRVKKLKVDIFTHVSPQKPLHQALTITSLKAERNYLFPLPMQRFFETLFSLSPE